MTLIHDIQAREIIDARGLPALEADVTLNSGALGRTSIPTGVPHELKDKDDRFNGQGLKQAIGQIEERIGLVLRGMDALDQTGIDRELLNMNRIAGNARLVVSLAVAQAAALALDLPLGRYLGGVNAKRLPLPLVQATERPGFPQNYRQALLMPINPTWTTAKALQAIAETNQQLLSTDTPSPENDLDRLDCLRHAIEQAGYSTEQDLALALELPETLPDGLHQLLQETPVQLLLARNIPENLPDTLNVPLATQCLNPQGKSAARILSPYDFQTLTDVLDEAERAQRAADTLILAATAPGTGDPILPELAMAMRANFLMAGPLSRFDAVTTYNQLLRLA